MIRTKPKPVVPEPERVEGRDQEPEITSKVTDELEEELPSETKKEGRAIKPLIAVMTASKSPVLTVDTARPAGPRPSRSPFFRMPLCPRGRSRRPG